MTLSSETITFLGDIANNFHEMFKVRELDTELYYMDDDEYRQYDNPSEFDKGLEIVQTFVRKRWNFIEFDKNAWIEFVKDKTSQDDLENVLHWMFDTDNSPHDAVEFGKMYMTPEEIEIALKRLNDEMGYC